MNLGLHRIFFIVLFFSNHLSSEPLSMKYAKLKLLDKISNKLIEKTIKVNDSIDLETLNIEVFACFSEPPEEVSEDYVLINIKDNFKNNDESIYRGWMISSSPEVTPLEHPIYDIWLLGCSNNKTS